MSKEQRDARTWLEKALRVDRDHMSQADVDGFTDRLYDDSLQPGAGDRRDEGGRGDRD